MRPLRQVLLLARHASENASAAAGGCPQSVESAVLRAFEDAFDVTGCRFLRFRKCIRWSRRLFSAPLKMRSVHQKAVSGTEYPFRTGQACFLHRMLLKMRRVPQEAFLSTECQFRTVEACFWYGALPKNASHLVVRSTGKLVAVASERPIQPRTGQGEWSARDKFRVSGTKEMVEGAGANKVSGVLSEASCCRCETSNFTKKEADLFSLFFVLNFFYNAEPPTRSRISEVIFC